MSKDFDIVGAENPAIVSAINNMITRGYSKESIQKITGAPYEVVDRHMKHRERENRGQRVPERDHNDE